MKGKTKEFLDRYLKYIVLAALLYMPIFGHLTTLPIRLWDESRVALNAFEMYSNGNLLVAHYNGEPDMWNTKPPLLVWIQAGLMKLIGPGELAVRLPSAFAALLTCLTLLLFSIRYLRSFWFGFIAIMVLITFDQYVDEHAIRTGDYDSLLTFFLTASTLAFFIYCEKRKPKFLYLTVGLLTAAVLTKSIAGLLMIPALFLYALWQKQLLALLKAKEFYTSILIFTIPVAAYYLSREMLNPGYLEAVYANELGGRYLEVVENHQHRFWHYYERFAIKTFTAWLVLIPCGVAIGLAYVRQTMRKLTGFATLVAICYFLIISVGQTKIEWYILPMLPFLAILVAVPIYSIFDVLREIKWATLMLRFNVVPYTFIFLLFVMPYRHIFFKTYKPQNHANQDHIYYESTHMKKALKGHVDLQGQQVLYDDYRAHIEFYLALLQDKGVDVVKGDKEALRVNDIVFASQGPMKDYISTSYDAEVINTSGEVTTYHVHGRK